MRNAQHLTSSHYSQLLSWHLYIDLFGVAVVVALQDWFPLPCFQHQLRGIRDCQPSGPHPTLVVDSALIQSRPSNSIRAKACCALVFNWRNIEAENKGWSLSTTSWLDCHWKIGIVSWNLSLSTTCETYMYGIHMCEFSRYSL